ncbi:MAG: histidine phosphatase family protein [Cyclobacteriaceae bacterium]|nr:histidine phosphatase family protein [Cyclobacteriaceae bacterium]
MKKIFVVRHAKSSWDEPELEDFDRPLNKRGKKSAPEMGKRMQQRGIAPDLLISSPAKRAFATAKLIARELSISPEKIQKEPRFYEATIPDFVGVLQSLSDEVNTVMIFSHNPGLTDLVNYLSDAGIFNVPTCGIAEIDLDIAGWKELDKRKGRLVLFDYPKWIAGSFN